MINKVITTAAIADGAATFDTPANVQFDATNVAYNAPFSWPTFPVTASTT